MSYTEEQYEEFSQRMEQQFPLMYGEPYGGFAVGPGWWPIIEELSTGIQTHIDWWNKNRETRPVVEQVKVRQIKEKFGGLRFYYDGGDEYVQGMVRMAEAWADHACEECGKPGKSRSGGWIRTLCDEHEVERQEQIKKRFKDET
jgi:hypothetical protein